MTLRALTIAAFGILALAACQRDAATGETTGATATPASTDGAGAPAGGTYYLSDCAGSEVERRTPELAGASPTMETPTVVSGPTDYTQISADNPGVVDCPFTRANGEAMTVRIRVTCLQGGVSPECVTFDSIR